MILFLKVVAQTEFEKGKHFPMSEKNIQLQCYSVVENKYQNQKCERLKSIHLLNTVHKHKHEGNKNDVNLANLLLFGIFPGSAL